ncbi:hypothetical protein LTR36_008139 [Oleoguttula mirabilis]|uniref:Uncharacterized protein n=1 Tax=Oleoguttula mirabilis TaxID=1507867 RepID=A0AAV9J8P4_9PEZI|nr:hypothetical protein LTR36_008139 [Oleoguttula mirabilis]
MELGQLRIEIGYTSLLSGFEPLDMLTGGRRIHKALRGCQGGIEYYWIDGNAAAKVGGEAVRAGLELILERMIDQ